MLDASKGSLRYPIPSHSPTILLMPHLVYILELLTGKLYVGSTTDLDRRLKDHGKGFGDRTTLLGGYKKIIYTESFPDRLSAHLRERQLKGVT